jgi:hypothetical protein
MPTTQPSCALANATPKSVFSVGSVRFTQV